MVPGTHRITKDNREGLAEKGIINSGNKKTILIRDKVCTQEVWICGNAIGDNPNLTLVECGLNAELADLGARSHT